MINGPKERGLKGSHTGATWITYLFQSLNIEVIKNKKAEGDDERNNVFNFQSVIVKNGKE